MLYEVSGLGAKSFSKPHPLKYKSSRSHIDRIGEFISPINATACVSLPLLYEGEAPSSSTILKIVRFYTDSAI